MSAALPLPAPRPRRLSARLLPGGVALGLALGLSACGANFQAQTYLERPVNDGANVAVGAIAVRNVAVVPGTDGTVAAGSDADVRLTLVNDGGDDDQLVEASSPAASSVGIVTTRTGQKQDSVTIPRLGTTGGTVQLVLHSVSKQLLSGQSIGLTLRFAKNGETTLAIPVAVTGVYDSSRPKSTDFEEPGENGEGPSPSAAPEGATRPSQSAPSGG